MEEQEKQLAQSWCFENGITETKIQLAWDNALEQGNFIVKNLSSHGFTWRKLPPHLLQQLIERYGKQMSCPGKSIG